MRSTRRPLVVLAMIGLIGVGCAAAPADGDPRADGEATEPSRGGSDAAATHAQAVRFSQCMRDAGVKDFPDPDAAGELTIDELANGGAVDTSSPAFEQALQGCKDLAPSGFTGHERSDEQQESALAFARCIRDHGVPDFPDPTPDAPLVDTNRIPSANGAGGMAKLNAAMQACGDLVSDLVDDR